MIAHIFVLNVNENTSEGYNIYYLMFGSIDKEDLSNWGIINFRTVKAYGKA